MSSDILNAETITYDQAKDLAQHADPAVRSKLARRTDLPPEVLYYLAEDESTHVRQEIAKNEAAPRQTDILLAKDTSAEVRSDLASKIALIAPGLTADEQNKARRATYEALELLAKDQITKVREILSDALKDVADAPADVIKTLAMDTEIEVSGPVLEMSPVLSDEDLLEIIEHGPAKGGLNAISRREQVSESVSDAIVGTDDVEAIADLLSNESAQIRESTLDDLVERASEVNLWHAPLVGRPKLPSHAATKMAHFLADNLLAVLQERTDMDADTMNAVKAVVQQRIGDDVEDGAQDFLYVDPPVEMVERLYKANKLDGVVINKALNAGDHGFVLATLVVRSGVPLNVVKKIFIEKSAKGIAALTWKGGMSAKMSAQIQQRMGRVAPSEAVNPTDDGKFPLSDDEMNFELEFFENLAAKSAG